MKTKNNFFMRKSLCVSGKDLKKLSAILKKFFSLIAYSATIKSGAIIEFDSLKELLTFNNFKENKIKVLNIHAQKKQNYETIQECYIRFDSKCGILNKSIDIDYCFSSQETEMLFVHEIQKFFYKPQKVLNRNIVLISVLILASLIFTSEIWIIYHDNILLMVVMLFLFTKTNVEFLEAFFEKNVSNVFFLWGEETSLFYKRKNLISKIFWGVIIAIVASIVGSFIYAKIM